MDASKFAALNPLNFLVKNVIKKDWFDIFELNKSLFDDVFCDKMIVKECCRQGTGFIFRYNGELLGYIIFSDYNRSVKVESFGVRQEYQKNGIGGKLLKMTIDKCFNKDINLYFGIKNIAMQKLCTKNNFSQIEEIKNYYKTPILNDRDVYHMKLPTQAVDRIDEKKINADEIIIKQISVGDTNILYDLNQIIFKDEILYEKSSIQAYCESKKGFVAFDKGTPIGYIIFEDVFNEFEPKNKTFTIISIGVKEEYRRQSVGSKLLRLVTSSFLDKDIYLHVRVKNRAAQKMYQKHGFKIISTIKNYYNLKKYGLEDAYAMKRPSLTDALKKSLQDKKNSRLGTLI